NERRLAATDVGAMQRSFCADKHIGVGVVVDFGDTPTGQQRAQLLGDARDAGANDAQLRRTALGTHCGLFLVGKNPYEVMTVGTRKQAEASAPIQDTDSRFVGIANRSRERVAEESRARRFLAPVDNLDTRPAGAFDIFAWSFDDVSYRADRFERRRG